MKHKEGGAEAISRQQAMQVHYWVFLKSFACGENDDARW